MSEKAKDTSHPRDDDRNDELDESPAPNPEERDTNAADDPQADSAPELHQDPRRRVLVVGVVA